VLFNAYRWTDGQIERPSRHSTGIKTLIEITFDKSDRQYRYYTAGRLTLIYIPRTHGRIYREAIEA
jgi:hypothetical protein